MIFFSRYLSISKVDEDLQNEYDAVISTGLFDIVLFSYEKWLNEGRSVIKNAPEKEAWGLVGRISNFIFGEIIDNQHFNTYNIFIVLYPISLGDFLV